MNALEAALGPDRRTFLKRALAGAFAAPAVTSFTMSGIAAVFGWKPGSTTLAITANGTPPPEPSFYDRVTCTTYVGGQFTLTVPDSVETVQFTFPVVNTFPSGTAVCFYKGDLIAIAPHLPPGHIPLSAWAVLWNGPNNADVTAAKPVKLRVVNPLVKNGDGIYDISGGGFTNVGTAIDGEWSLLFSDDPSFVVTRFVPLPEPPAATPTPVVTRPTTTG